MATPLPSELLTRNAAWSMDLDLYADSKRTVPLSLNGYTVEAQFNAVSGDPTSKAAEITCTVGTRDAVTEVFTPDPTGNVVRLSLTQAEVLAITAETVYADVIMGPTGGDPERIAYFSATVGEGETVWGV